MHQDSIDKFRRFVHDTKVVRAHRRDLVSSGRWQEAEPDHIRSKLVSARLARNSNVGGRESLEGPTLDYQPSQFLVKGATTIRAVAYVETSVGARNELGTGFMISPRLFITNQHVIQNETAAMGTTITFDRELDMAGRPRPTSSFSLIPETFAIFSNEDILDYAIIAVGQRLSGGALLSEIGYCPLSNAPDKHQLGMNANIIQHPQGSNKKISIRNNLLVARSDTTLLYESDTDKGSSGSPVLNDDWEVISLHHYGEPFLERTDSNGKPFPTTVNEGVRISAIFIDLETKLSTLCNEWRPLLEEALSLGRNTVSPSVPILGPPRALPRTIPQPSLALVSKPESKRIEPIMEESNRLVQTIPLVVSISLGYPEGQRVAESAQLASTPASSSLVLGRKAESLSVDVDYSNRTGYKVDFIPGINLPLPTLTGDVAASLAPLRATEPNAAEGELRYEHFSIKMNRSKHMAIFTATNIDGKTYLIVDRKTGDISDRSEGETWFRDPRISSSVFLDQTFYSEWSTYFDRGHLTRRTDPTWGTPDMATRANADTFHFTNCTPQHFRFNQTAKYWQGVERYVLENGVLAQETKSRICVFQGPIFDESIDRTAQSDGEQIQIPSAFFKVVVWKSNSGLKSVGLVVDQGALLDEPRRYLGQPNALPSVNVKHWRVGIPAIEERTGLDFGKDLRDADTIKQLQQPAVGGAEALKGQLIQKMEDIVL